MSPSQPSARRVATRDVHAHCKPRRCGADGEGDPRGARVNQDSAPDVSPAAQAPTELGFDQKQVEEFWGTPGRSTVGVLQIGVPRSEVITDSGMTVPPSMGVATALNFQPTGNGKAAITGDFVLLGSEVDPVMKALRQNGSK